MTKKPKKVSSWSDFNAESRFRPIDVEFEDYVDIHHSQPIVKDKYGVLDALNIDTDKNPQRVDVQRRYRIKMKPAVSRFAFPTRSGYTTYRDYSTGKFYCDLFNLCKSHGLYEPKLLINHALLQPWWPSIYYNPDYKADIDIDERYCKLFHSLQRHLLSKSELDDVRFYMHKNTTPGPPFTFFGGQPYDPKDVLYGMDIDKQLLTMLALRKDYTQVKQTFLSNSLYIHEKQVEYSKNPSLLVDEFLKAYFEGIIPVGVEGGRLNGPDAPINIDRNHVANINYIYYVKARKCTLFQNGYIYFGEILIKKLTDYLISVSGAGWGGGLARPRGVTNIAWASQISPAISSKMLTHKLEESANGFASNSEVCKHAYNNFLSECNASHGDFLFLNGDRSNAESFVTSNYEQFGKLVIPELKDLYDFQNSAYMVGRNNYYFSGLASGMARTTELNWHAGTYEAIYTLSQLLRVDITTVAEEYFQSIISNASFFKIGPFIVKLFMCTDDIPLIIHGPLEKLDMSVISEDRAKKRLMTWNTSKDEMSTFGMHFTKFKLEPNEVSVISKLFYSEHPGFFVKDCFSLYSKLQMLSPDLKKDVLTLLDKHYHTDEGFYADASKAFFGWLSEFGVNVSTVVDIYSPSGKVMYGDLVEKDAVLKSSRVASTYVEPIFNYYKGQIR